MGPGDIQLPPDLPNWRVVKEALKELRGKLVNKTTNPQEVGWFMQVIYTTIQSDQCSPGNISSQLSLLKAKIQAKLKQKLDHSCLWYGMAKFLKKVPSEEKEQFMNSTFPSIIEIALRIEEFMKKESIVWSKQQIGGKIVLSRKFVCAIVACFFLCLFPERKRHSKQPVNIINFTAFYKHLPMSTQIAKLRCILHYFECVIQRNMEVEGNVLFHRKVVPSDLLLNFNHLSKCGLALCPLTITDGKIEDSGREVMQICFGNKSLGGGVLGKSRVQEEIRFSTCPELIVGMLMVENMEDNEAVEMCGFEQMSCYRGYGQSFQFDGHCDGAFVDPGKYFLVTIDATPYRGKEHIKQYEEEFVLRDLNKALIGFCDASSNQINLPLGKSGTEEAKPQEIENVPGKRMGSTPKKNNSKTSMSVRQHHKVESPGLPRVQDIEVLRKMDVGKTDIGKTDVGKTDVFSMENKLLSLEGKDIPLHIESRVQQPPTLPPHPPHWQPPSSAETFPGPCVPFEEDFVDFQEHSDKDVETSISLPSHSHMVSDGLPGAICIPFPNSLSRQPLSSTASSTPVPIPTSCDLSPQPLSSMASSTPVPIPMSGPQASSPLWPQSHAPLHSFLTAESSLSNSIHSSVRLVAAVEDQADSAIGLENFSQVDSHPRQSFPSALSNPLLTSGSHESFPLLAKYYSDVLGNLTTADTGALDSRATPLPCPLTFFKPADVTETDYNCCHSAKQPSSSSDTHLKSKREGIFKQMAHSSLDLETKGTLQNRKCLEIEKTGSDVSNYSMMVSVDSQSASVQSLDDCSSIATSPSQDGAPLKNDNVTLLDDSVTVLSSKLSTSRLSFLSADQNRPSHSHHNILPSHFDAGVLLEPPRSSSPHSSGSSLNHSANSSIGIQDSGNIKTFSSQLVEEFFNPCDMPNPQNGTRDFHTEVREWISASSSSSVIPAPSSSSNEGSHWGSRSGSLSSHGTSGSHQEMGELWPGHRRRSSQMSDVSRRSSSSKHSSDLGTDLEEISETLAKQGHTVIEEEGSQLALNVDSEDVNNATDDDLTKGDIEQTDLSFKLTREDVEDNEPKSKTAVARRNASADQIRPSKTGPSKTASDYQPSIQPLTFPDTMGGTDVSETTKGGEDLLEGRETWSHNPIASTVHSGDCQVAILEGNAGPRNMTCISLHEPVTLDTNEEKLTSNTSHDLSEQEASRKDESEVMTIKRVSYSTTSRYLFSDVASAPSDQLNYEYQAISPIPDAGNAHLGSDSSKSEFHQESVTSTLVTNPLMSLFISNLAKMALKEACSEGAQITSGHSLEKREEKEMISDEIYTLFATDIVSQVFVHVLSSIESRDVNISPLPINLDFQVREETSLEAGRPCFKKLSLEGEENLRLSSGLATQPHTSTAYLNLAQPKSTTDLSFHHVMPSLSQSAFSRSVPSLAPVNSKPSSQKPKNLSSLTSKALGICKTVSFEDSCTESRSNAESPVAGLTQKSEITSPESGFLSSVSQKASACAASLFSKDSHFSTGFQNSQDILKQTSVMSPSVPRLSHSHSALELSRRYSLTSSDYDIHQTATAIVNQVFQSISDSLGKDNSLVGIARFSDASDSAFSTSVNNYRWGQGDGFVSNIFSSSPTKSHSSSRYSSHSQSLGILSRKPMSREGLTNAYLKVDSTPSIKTYERRCSEPCHTSVQLSLQAFNDNRYNCKQAEEKQAKLSCTDDEIHQVRTWRRGSLDGFTFERRRNSCGFKDPVLSRFAEELMKADTSVPELLLFGSHHSSSTTGSRRSSISGFKDTTLANLESELLNTSFTSICSLSLSQSPRSQHRQSRASLRSRSWELRQGKSDSSDTEHLFPLPRYVGDEFLHEYRKQYGHDEDEKNLSGSMNSLMTSKPNWQLLQSDPELQTQEERLMERFATNLCNDILLEAFSCRKFEDEAMAGTEGEEIRPTKVKEVDSDVGAGHLSISNSSSAYFGEGARPKLSGETRTASKARPVPQRKSDVRRAHGDSWSGDGMGYQSGGGDCMTSLSQRPTPRSSSTGTKERHSFIPLFKRLMSQEKASENTPSSAPTLISSSSSLPAVSAQSNFSRVHRHHFLSKSASGQLSASSSDLTASSTSSIPKAVRREEKRRRASSETPFSYPAGIRPPSSADRANLQTVLKWPLQYEKHHDDSVDSILSSCSDSSSHSGQTRSSLLSASLSDSEGSKPRSNGNKQKVSQAERKKRMVVRQAAIVKEPSKPVHSTVSQGRPRRDRGRKRSLSKLRPKKEIRELAYQFLSPKADLYADSLSRTIVAEALKDFTQLKWKLYASYNRAIATGNWGCGAFKGNAQLKLVLQWIAASVAKAPHLMYYTFGDSRLNQAKDVVQELSSWSVGELCLALQDYCYWARCHMSDPDTCASSSTSWIYGLLHLKIGCGRQPSGDVSQDEALPISLFDYLLNFHKNKEH